MPNSNPPDKTIRSNTNVIEFHERVVRKRAITDVENERIWIEAVALKLLGDVGISPQLRLQGEENGRAFIEMDRLSGETLQGYCFDSNNNRKQIAFSAALSLSIIHDFGIIHGDFKPSNILVSDEGQVFVIDYGNSNHVDSVEVSNSQFIYSTPSIIAPELLKGSKKPTLTCDVFSLGVTLYFIFSGEFPFVGKSSVEISDSICFSDPKPIATPAWAIIKNCLQKNPQDRYQTATEVVADFGRLFNEAPILDRSPSTLQAVRRTAKSVCSRYGKPILSISFASVLLGVLACFLVMQAWPPSRMDRLKAFAARGEVPVRLVSHSGGPVTLTNSDTHFELDPSDIQVIPAGTYLATFTDPVTQKKHYSIRVVENLGKIPLRRSSDALSLFRAFSNSGVYKNGILHYVKLHGCKEPSSFNVKIEKKPTLFRPFGFASDLAEQSNNMRLPTKSELVASGKDPEEFHYIEACKLDRKGKICFVPRDGNLIKKINFDLLD